jgi:predicted nucleic acid-binding protein
VTGIRNRPASQAGGQGHSNRQSTIAVDVVSDDETDNRILECVVAGKTDLVVSGGRHLLRLKSFERIGIVRAADLHRTLGNVTAAPAELTAR